MRRRGLSLDEGGERVIGGKVTNHVIGGGNEQDLEIAVDRVGRGV